MGSPIHQAPGTNGVVLVGLSEIERQILMRELAEIVADLSDLQRRAVEITARVESERLVRPA
ncbi:hypothetical protein GCM10010404_34700 [Nonomuraea africana]